MDEDYEVSFELITTGTLTEAALNDLEAFQQELAKLSEKEDFDATIHVIDGEELRRRYEYAIETDNPSINYSLNLAGTNSCTMKSPEPPVLIAAMPLKECIKLPGIKDGTLFQKNVRQSLGSSNVVNKGIRATIIGDKRRDFFFFHNGITALCNKMQLDGDTLTLRGLSVVNGCQSLNTILSCSETVKKLDDTFILFRFYEIPQRDRADKISIFTNSQSAVKARDLRSNDKRVLAIKKAFELKYPSGFFLTKRGQTAPPEKNKDQVVELSTFAKNLIAWHSQRPNLSYGETKIFDKYFETLFKNKDYPPESVLALTTWMNEVMKTWVPTNPLNLNETLLAMRAYAPFHHLYAVEMCFSISNNQAEKVASPSKSYATATRAGMVDEIVKVAGISLNMALEAAANEPQPANRVFSPQNWIKTKGCLAGINGAIRNYYNMLPMMPGGVDAPLAVGPRRRCRNAARIDAEKIAPCRQNVGSAAARRPGGSGFDEAPVEGADDCAEFRFIEHMQPVADGEFFHVAKKCIDAHQRVGRRHSGFEAATLGDTGAHRGIDDLLGKDLASPRV